VTTHTYRNPFDPIFERAKNEEWRTLGKSKVEIREIRKGMAGVPLAFCLMRATAHKGEISGFPYLRKFAR
jgi:hypothetical protein